MENLWAPWRMSYLRGVTETEDGCLFCRMLAEDQDENNLILHRSMHAVIMLNRYPYNNGHMMIVPIQHVASLEDVTPDAMMELAVLIQIAIRSLRIAYSPEGFNVGVNIGEAAGAGIPGHVHAHVLPRWMGDTNFMTTIAETRVIPEELSVTLGRLREIMNELLRDRW